MRHSLINCCASVTERPCLATRVLVLHPQDRRAICRAYHARRCLAQRPLALLAPRTTEATCRTGAASLTLIQTMTMTTDRVSQTETVIWSEIDNISQTRRHRHCARMTRALRSADIHNHVPTPGAHRRGDRARTYRPHLGRTVIQATHTTTMMITTIMLRSKLH
jgi:hypothetical protein